VGEDNYIINARLKSHIPEILPIAGRRIHVSYPGQLKQCKRCFGQGHVNATCTSPQRIDWLEYVSSLLKSGKFDEHLFDGWMTSLKAYHPEYQENADLRQVLEFGRINRQNQQAQGSQSQSNTTQPVQGNQTNQNTQNQWGQRRGYQGWRGNRGRGRGRGRGSNSRSFVLQQY